jgi:hypothetical protein
MTETPPDDPMMPLLIQELRGLLTRENLIDPVNLRIAGQAGWVLLHIMAVSTGTLGVLLATLSDPAELRDPGSLSCRITPGDDHGRPGQWQYELIASRYPINKDIVFSAKVRLPAADLPEVISRLRRHR